MMFPKNKRIKLSQHKYRQLCEYVYARDGFCLLCGVTDSATPAHVKRRSQNGDDSPNNIIRLCIPCHQRFDKYEVELPEEVLLMLENEPLNLTGGK